MGAPGSLVRWDDVETDGTVLLQREETGGCRVINLDALTFKVKASLLRLNPNSRQAVMHLYDLDGTPVRDGVVPIENRLGGSVVPGSRAVCKTAAVAGGASSPHSHFFARLAATPDRRPLMT